MQRRQTLILSLLAASAVVGVWACGKDSTNEPGNTGGTSPGSYQGIDDNQANLTPLSTACAFSADGGIMTVQLAPGEYSLIAKDPSGSLTVNGTPCATATASNTTRINVSGVPDGGNTTVILDYLNGSFALGSASSPGVLVDLKPGANHALKIRGTSTADQIYLATVAADAGASGVYALSLGLAGATASGNKNVQFANVQSLVVSTGPGDDVFYTNGKADAGLGGTPFGKAASGTGPTLTIYGGEGNDTLFMGAAKGGAVIFSGGSEVDAGTGSDTIDFTARVNALTCTIGGGQTCGESNEASVLTDVEVLKGGAGDDTLACEAVTACTINGGAGNDTITGSSAGDTLSGGAGNDTIIPGAGDDTVSGGAGIDTVSYSDRTNPVTVVLGNAGAAQANSGEASLDGGVNENDTIDTCENIVGGAGDDTLTGNDLDNVITGGAGNDTMSGGPGNDTFFMGSAPAGNDTIDGQAGEDKLDYSLRTGDLTLTLNGSTATTGNGESTENTSIANVEDLVCGSGADTVTGDANNNVLEGGAGDDTINAGAGDDIVDPGAGNNTVTCGTGNDILLPGGTTTNAAHDCEN